MIAFLIASGAAVSATVPQKNSCATGFVRRRAHKPATPFIAGIGAYLIALVVVGLLPSSDGNRSRVRSERGVRTAAGSRQVKSGNLPYLGSG